MSDEQAPNPPKKKSRWLWIVLLLVLMLGGGGAAAWYVLVMQPAQAQLDGEAPEPTPAPALYSELRPAFVVNLAGNRFLQLEIDLMARDAAVIEAVKRHNPAIRNDVLLLLGSQNPSELQSLDGKLTLQQSVLDAINAILAAREQGLAVEEIYFSSFVMQ